MRHLHRCQQQSRPINTTLPLSLSPAFPLSIFLSLSVHISNVAVDMHMTATAEMKTISISIVYFYLLQTTTATTTTTMTVTVTLAATLSATATATESATRPSGETCRSCSCSRWHTPDGFQCAQCPHAHCAAVRPAGSAGTEQLTLFSWERGEGLYRCAEVHLVQIDTVFFCFAQKSKGFLQDFHDRFGRLKVIAVNGREEEFFDGQKY